MVGADEVALDPAARLRDLGAAVATDIQEGAHLAGIVAHHQYRHAAGVVGEVVARLGNAASEAHHEGMATEQYLHLPIEAIGIRVRLHGIRGNVVCETGGPRVDVGEKLPRERDLQCAIHRGALELAPAPATLPADLRNDEADDHARQQDARAGQEPVALRALLERAVPQPGGIEIC